MELNKAAIESIIEQFKNQKRVFSNESQFQFEFGRALEKEGYKVFFEVLSIDDNEKDAKRRKIYTDIVVDLGDNEFAAIELKYKSAGKPSTENIGFDGRIGAFLYPDNDKNPQYVFPQGAINEGLYFFLKDVERLEKSVRHEVEFNFDNKKTITTGYAILMANSKSDSKSTYWSSQKNKKGDKTCADFSLEEAKEVKRGTLKWSEKSSAKDWSEINIRGKYKCAWKDYYSNHSYPIKYLIFEIKPPNS